MPCLGRVYIVGGEDGRRALNTVEVLDAEVELKHWTRLTHGRHSLPMQQCAWTIALVANRTVTEDAMWLPMDVWFIILARLQNVDFRVLE